MDALKAQDEPGMKATLASVTAIEGPTGSYGSYGRALATRSADGSGAGK